MLVCLRLWFPFNTNLLPFNPTQLVSFLTNADSDLPFDSAKQNPSQKGKSTIFLSKFKWKRKRAFSRVPDPKPKEAVGWGVGSFAPLQNQTGRESFGLDPGHLIALAFDQHSSWQLKAQILWMDTKSIQRTPKTPWLKLWLVGWYLPWGIKSFQDFLGAGFRPSTVGVNPLWEDQGPDA